MAEIRIENLHKAFGSFVAVRDANLVVHHGEFVCLLGPSGCGKTTTLRMIAGLELPSSGRIRLDGEDVTMQRASQRDIAFVFQLFALYPHLNVRANIAFPLQSQGMLRSEVKRRVEAAAAMLRISHLLEHSVSGLAAGDRQRVALGRALVREPKAFLMDEPLGALDAEFRELMCDELRGLHDRIGATTVYVTHDQAEAMSMADRIAVMNQGRIEQYATPQEIYDRPATRFVADFIGSPPMNLLPCTAPGEGLAQGAGSVHLGATEVPVPPLARAVHGRNFTLGIRPEHVRLDDSSALRARVLASEYLGTLQIVYLSIGTGERQLRARLRSDLELGVGDQVGISLDTQRISLFDAQGSALDTMPQGGTAYGTTAYGTTAYGKTAHGKTAHGTTAHGKTAPGGTAHG